MMKNLPPGLSLQLKETFGKSEVHKGDPIFNLMSLKYKAASKESSQKDALVNLVTKNKPHFSSEVSCFCMMPVDEKTI
jgi:hypothetical protein